ncbi:hypothetical protein [Actinokineospora sp. NPDC004072]
MPTARSLNARADALRNRLAQLAEQQADAQVRSDVERSKMRARTAREALIAAVGVKQALLDRGISLAPLPEAEVSKVAAAKRNLRTVATGVVGQNSKDISRRISSKPADEALSTAESTAARISRQLAAAVDQKRVELLPEGIEATIASYPGVSESLVVGLKSVQRRLTRKVVPNEIASLPAQYDEILADVERWRRDHPRLAEELANHHPEIREFIRRAASEAGAPWDLITPRVQQWLANPENSSSLKVVIRP